MSRLKAALLQVFDQLLLGLGKFFRDLKVDLDVEVAAGAFGPGRQPTAFEAESGVGLGPGRHFDIKGFTAQGGDIYTASKYR
jgi:hypothetical protein